jgi:hypothetical protein
VGKLIWYYKRLMSMSLNEIVFRAQGLIHSKLQSMGWLIVLQPPVPRFVQDEKLWVGIPAGLTQDQYKLQAEAVITGKLKVFGLDDAALGVVPDWNTDPLTGIRAPDVFGKTLNYRDERIVGNIKYLWEPNRHLQLVQIAQAYALTRDDVYLSKLRVQLESWLDQCLYMIGPNWNSSLELGIRLINWSLVWQYVGGMQSPLFEGPEGESFRRRWLDSVYQHVHFVDGHYSRFSSANNHLIGEAAGVIVACKTWPFWDDFSKFCENGMVILEREIQTQNHADGVNREQAVSYQQFVLDFAIIAGLACKVTGDPLSELFWRRVEGMIGYLAALIDYGGNVPMIGDADDGYVVNLSPEADFCPYKSLLATGAVLFKRGDFKSKAKGLDHKTLWLLGPSAADSFGSLAASGVKQELAFKSGGYYFLGKDWDTPCEVKAMVDCGSLGYLSIAAHGHADALSIYLSAGGNELLVDVGTYAYHTNKMWRDYFRGTSAHNTVRIDGADQSVIGGNFMWMKKAESTLIEFVDDDDVMYFKGGHNGYERLDDPVIHTREIQFNKSGNRFFIKDKLDCKAAHDVERYWHFHEDCILVEHDGGIQATNGASSLFLRPIEDDVYMEVIKGDEGKPLGWVSRSFDRKVPAHTLVMKTNIEGATVLGVEIVVDIDC